MLPLGPRRSGFQHFQHVCYCNWLRYFLLTKGVLSLPYAIKLNGIIPGLIAMAVAAVASIWSMRLIVACSNATECRSFGKITQIGGGKVLSLTLDIMILIYTTGVSITFICISKPASHS